ncbi:MAG: ATP-binding protein [candidate division KSB1 bacterium]
MNAIIGLTHLLQRSGASTQQSERLGKIESAATHLLTIINDILDISKIEAGRLELEDIPFSLSATIENVRTLVLTQAASKGLTIAVHEMNTPVWLRGDPTRVRQALLNYLSNAIKFSNNGMIHIRVSTVDLRGADLTLRFEVQDNGIGIAPEKHRNLFQYFEQADTSTTRRFGGTGLGLAITRRIAELMGGTVGVDSTPGRGSTFWFTAQFQVASVPVVAATPAVADAESALRLRPIAAHVLLVDDSETNREVAKALLESVGIRVEMAENGQQAVARVAGEHFDLILMDIQMPEMDGITATKILRGFPEMEHVPILAMTANVYAEDRKACLEAAMNDFVPKPVDPEVLYSTILRWLPPVVTENQTNGLADLASVHEASVHMPALS